MLKFLYSGYDIAKLHLIGHSLGGQCIGLVGRHLKKLSNNSFVIPRLYALDPAGPGFEKENTLSKFLKWVTFKKVDFPMISRDDADYVQVIHTNAGKYGIIESRGHADFFPNAGADQAGCDLSVMDDVCSHSRAWYYFQESVKNIGAFPAIKCNSYEDFKNNNCEKEEVALMGLSHDITIQGNFYLQTHPNPLQTSLGNDGMEYRKLTVFSRDGLKEDAELRVLKKDSDNFDVEMSDDYIKDFCKKYRSGSARLSIFISLILINFLSVFI